MSRLREEFAALLGAVLTLSACEGDRIVRPIPTEPPPSQLRIEKAIPSGDGQSDTVRAILKSPYRVRVLRDSVPAASVAVAWTVPSSQGSVSASTTYTDAAGIASVTRTLGPSAGLHTAQAILPAATGSPVTFRATARLPVVTLQKTATDHGDGQTDTVNATLAAPLRVRVLREGIPWPGATVVWEWSGGTLSASTTRTDASGIASVQWSLGDWAGSYSATASFSGASGSPLTFTATAGPGHPTRFVLAAGDKQLGSSGAALFDDYVARVTDRHGNGVAGVGIEWAVTDGGGSIAPAQATTQASGLFGAGEVRARHTLGSADGPNHATATAPALPGAPQLTFRSTAVSVRVDVLDSQFVADSVLVAVGGAVGWTWVPDYYCYYYGYYYCTGHNVIFEDDPAEPTSSPTQIVGTHARTFTAPGTYRYRCTIHSQDFSSGMVGRVVVQ